MDDNVIEIENITKIYNLYDKPVDRLKEALNPFKKKYHKKFYALNDLSLVIRPGEIVGLIGKNGAGKSTLLKTITGVITPTSGNIKVNGRISALLELGAGFNLEYTGIQNIYVSGTMMGYTKKEIDNRINEIIEFSELGDFIYQPVKTYSSGMFARLAFAVAINVEPDILIIDEALSVGDLKFQQKALRKMKDLMKRAKAILFVSHDITSIRNLCSRAIWMMDGKVFMDGNTKKITRIYDDFMSHGILPEKEDINTLELDKKVIHQASKQKSDMFDELIWEDVNNGNSIGGKEGIIKKVAFYTNKPFKRIIELEKERQLVIFLQIHTFSRIKNPLIGIGIFNQKGVPIIHISSYSLNIELDDFKENEVINLKIDFTIPNLANGNYFLAVGFDSGIYPEHKVVHRVNEVLSFKVNRRDIFSYQHGAVIIEEANIKLI